MWAPAILKGLEKLRIRSGFPYHDETPSFDYWLLYGKRLNGLLCLLWLSFWKLFRFIFSPFSQIWCFSLNPIKNAGWICWLRCRTLINIIATFAKTNILSWSVLFQVTKVSFVNIWFGCMATPNFDAFQE